MRLSRFLCFAGIVVLPLAAAAFLHEAAVELTAAPTDFLDIPSALAADAEGNVYVSFRTDTMECFVRRFSSGGAVLAAWVVGGSAQVCDVAEAGDGGVFVSLPGAGVVRHFKADGTQTHAWPVDRLLGPIAVDPAYSGAETDVYVLADATGNQREVRRFSGIGDPLGAFPAAHSSFDLTAWPASDAQETEVVVAEGNRALDGPPYFARYTLGGSKLGEWEGGGAGMDFDLANNRIWSGVMAVIPATIRRFEAYARDGARDRRCELTAFPVDLAVGGDGDLYIIAFEDFRQDTLREVLRVGQDCKLKDVWGLEQLNGLEQPTPTGSTPTASEAPTHEPSATDTAAAVAATATETPGSASPTTTPTSGPTPTYHTVGGTLHLPIASRGNA